MKYFNLFSNIQITKGACRILISDLQRNVSELYPLELYEIVEELKSLSIEDIRKNYDKESVEIFNDYLSLLLEKEYGFVTENDWDKNFPPLSLEYLEPSRITNIFIETENIDLIKKIRPSVESLGIQHLTLYSTAPLSEEDLIEIDKIFESSVLSGIEIFSPFHQKIDEFFIQQLHKNTRRIYSFVFYGCPQKPFKTKEEYRFSIQYIKEDLKISACGKINVKYFNTNLPKVLEAVHHNSCLHKKMGIDRNDNIKNCPLMPESFGNIQHQSLEEILNQKRFKKYWNLTKDHIEVCKDCEFRYVCTDCRAYTENTHHNKKGLDTSKPLKCSYNPYTCTWEE
ncbi:grasp-with-spasm system SPASM domain peptide maturase [Chryseobacterium sp.]|uniref:grasp-with-spasm system SPASM domain peptide maturase n=1 Tax=Chryseobacterium sp. TaxID=1871047 RepID=UPI0026287469|nr:grasp-with-spasm system SPASM domain peptide maturase [Chryseobacterium sp.]